MNRFEDKNGVQLWRLGPRKYAGKYREMGEGKTVAEIHEALQDIVNEVNDEFAEMFGKKHEGSEVIIKIMPNVAPRNENVYDMMADPLREDRVYMTVGYKAWLEVEVGKDDT